MIAKCIPRIPGYISWADQLLPSVTGQFLASPSGTREAKNVSGLTCAVWLTTSIFGFSWLPMNLIGELNFVALCHTAVTTDAITFKEVYVSWCLVQCFNTWGRGRLD